MMKFPALLTIIMTIFSLFLFSGCVQVDFDNLEDLEIIALDEIDVFAGTYTVEYTINDLEHYVSTYGVSIAIEVVDQFENSIPIDEDTFTVGADMVYTVTITVNDSKGQMVVNHILTVNGIPLVITGLEMTALPTQTSYVVGEYFNPDGMVLSAVKNNGDREIVTGYTYNTMPLTENDEQFVIGYQTFELVIPLTINPPVLDFEIPGQLFYSYGCLSFNGSQEALYFEMDINGIVHEINTTCVDLISYLPSPGIFDVKIRAVYQSGTSEYSETLEIDLDIIDVELTGSLTKTAYIEGDLIDESGLMLTAIHRDGTRIIVETFDYTLSIDRPLMPSDQELVVTYRLTEETFVIPIVVLPIAGLSFTVTFSGNGGILMSGDEIQEISYGEDATPPVYSRKGYQFSGFDQIFTGVTSALVINAQWIDLSVGTSGLTYDINGTGDGYVVSGYDGTERHVVIATSYLGLPVKAVASDAFFMNTIIDSVHFPMGITAIAPFAFYSNPNLKMFTVSDDNPTYASHDGVLYSKDFKNLLLAPQALTGTLSIMEGVERIGFRAFGDAINLVDITFPESLYQIQSQAFYNTGWYAAQADGVVYAGHVAYAYKGLMPTDTVITLGDETKGIAAGAFSGQENLLEIVLPEGLLAIGASAFEGATRLDYVDLPDSLLSIGAQAFRLAIALSHIYFPDSLQEIGLNAFDGTAWYGRQADGPLYIARVLYELKGEAHDSVIINEGTIAIADGVFQDSLVTNIHIPDSVIAIGANAFSNAQGLTKIMIPATVTKIGNYAFSSTYLTIYAEVAAELPGLARFQSGSAAGGL